ncbi:MAG: NAD-dependent epimerase/dehydratase family protein [Parachlamydiales bacterium]|jgi:nucleoside-diphosphate-sugar epimerase
MKTTSTIIGCGYVGKAVAALWVQNNLSVHAITTRKENNDALEDLGCVPFVIQDEDSLANAVADARVILVSVAPSQNRSYEATYLHTAKALLDVLSKQKNFPHIIFTSSASVYGAYDNEIVTEDTPLLPENPENQILAQTESLLLDYPYTTILRFGEIIGPGRELYLRLKKMQGPFPGDGLNICNFTNLSDAVRAIEFVRTNKFYGIYNVVCDEHPTRLALYERLSEKMQLPLPRWDPTLMSRLGSKKIVSNNKLSQLQFAFSPPFGLD